MALVRNWYFDDLMIAQCLGQCPGLPNLDCSSLMTLENSDRKIADGESNLLTLLNALRHRERRRNILFEMPSPEGKMSGQNGITHFLSLGKWLRSTSIVSSICSLGAILETLLHIHQLGRNFPPVLVPLWGDQPRKVWRRSVAAGMAPRKSGAKPYAIGQLILLQASSYRRLVLATELVICGPPEFGSIPMSGDFP